MKVFFCLLFVFTTGFVQSQTKPKPKPKPEIDVLYEKYKDKKTIILHTPYGELEGEVEIEINSNGKPSQIKIFGQSKNSKAIAEFISNTMVLKESKGYLAKKVPFIWEHKDNYENSPYNIILEEMEHGGTDVFMTKVNMFFTSKIAHPKSESIMDTDYETWYFEIITGDRNRQGGKGSETFDF